MSALIPSADQNSPVTDQKAIELPSSLSRRDVLLRCGALGGSASLAALGAGILAPGVANAATGSRTWPSRSKDAWVDVVIGNTTYQYATWYMVGSSVQSSDTFHLTKVKGTADSNLQGTRVFYDGNGTQTVEYVTGFSVTVANGDLKGTWTRGATVLASRFGNPDSGRSYADINWSLPSDATDVKAFKSEETNATQYSIWAVSYKSNGGYKLKIEGRRWNMELEKYESTGVSKVITGTERTNWIEKYNNYAADLVAANNTHGGKKTGALVCGGIAVAACIFIPGAAEATLVARLSLALAAAALTVAGVGANAAVQLPVQTVRKSHNALFNYTDQITGFNVSRL